MALPPTPSEEDLRSSQWNPWVISSVAVICIFIVILSYLRIFRQLCSAQRGIITFSRNRNQRRLLNDTNSNDPSSIQFHSHGLEFSVIGSLPVVQFKEKKEEEEEGRKNSTECAVCLGEFKKGEWLRHLPNCSHAFHISCIDTWFQSHSSCPLCRSEVQGVSTDESECSVSVYTLLQTVRREEFFQDRANHHHHQYQRSEIMQSSSI
ncbi:hypothetical protein UlMin_013524 [Ulmus minor]